jgi:hypothetical protein
LISASNCIIKKKIKPLRITLLGAFYTLQLCWGIADLKCQSAKNHYFFMKLMRVYLDYMFVTLFTRAPMTSMVYRFLFKRRALFFLMEMIYTPYTYTHYDLFSLQNYITVSKLKNVKRKVKKKSDLLHTRPKRFRGVYFLTF